MIAKPCLLCRTQYGEGSLGYITFGDKFQPKERTEIKVDTENKADMVYHPSHYQHGIEPIEFIESHNLNFNLGSVIKYIARAPYKGTELQDLKKAKWFIEREIKRHEK
jgi:hypothetical protein